MPPGDRLQIATIGVGIQGINDTRTALRVPGVELVAAADVYDGRLTLAKETWGDHVFTSRDYREVLARPEVDAVIIATPDHWHARMAIDAMKAGKDVYVEKPIVQDIEEGPQVIEAERQTKRILQVGSQRVSSMVYAKARELFRAGAIGELNLVEAWMNRNSSNGAWQYSIPAGRVAGDDRLGSLHRQRAQAAVRADAPVPMAQLSRLRNRHPWRSLRASLHGHPFRARLARAPRASWRPAVLRHWIDGRDVPDVMLALYDYPKTAAHPAFTLSLKVNFANGGGDDQAFRFIGPDGMLTIGSGAVTLSRRPRAKDPGHTSDTFAKAMQEAYHERAPREISRSRPNCGRPTKRSTPRRRATATASSTSAISSTPCARAARWSKTRRSAIERRRRRC